MNQEKARGVVQPDVKEEGTGITGRDTMERITEAWAALTDGCLEAARISIGGYTLCWNK